MSTITTPSTSTRLSTPWPRIPRLADYLDGQYSADGWYGGLPSSIGVTLTLAEDMVTAVEVTPHATNPTSLDLQQRFAEAIPDAVIGRDIDELQIDRLAGSSGTPVGFHDALDQIKSHSCRRLTRRHHDERRHQPADTNPDSRSNSRSSKLYRAQNAAMTSA